MQGRDLILKNVRPWAGDKRDVLIRDGRIAASTTLPTPDAAEEDCGGALLLPGFVEAHTHLDKTHWGLPWRPHRTGRTIAERAANGRQAKRDLGLDAFTQAMAQVRQTVPLGTTTIRSHVDVDTEVGLRSIEGVVAARAASTNLVDIEIVAFPQSGLLVRPGTAELMEDALRNGADVVGGLDPSLVDGDPKGHLDLVFALADRFAKPVDIHLHEPGEVGAFALELIAERTRALGLGGRVTASHAFCLGLPDSPRLHQLAALLAEAGVAVMTTGPCDRTAPPIIALTDAGVRLCAGSDGIRDAWSPYGNGDMLERAMLLGLSNGLREDPQIETALRVCTYGGAAVLGLEGYGLEAGAVADLVTVDAQTLAQAVVARPPRQLVVKQGAIVARRGMLQE